MIPYVGIWQNQNPSGKRVLLCRQWSLKSGCAALAASELSKTPFTSLEVHNYIELPSYSKLVIKSLKCIGYVCINNYIYVVRACMYAC